MADSSDRPSLTVLGGPMSGTTYTVQDAVEQVLIGSDATCTLRLDVASVSPVHARLWFDSEGVTVFDTQSAQGLYVNDDKVEGHQTLRNGDVLWLGAPGGEDIVMVQLRLPAPKPAAASAAPTATPEEPAAVPAEPEPEDEYAEPVEDDGPATTAAAATEPAPEYAEYAEPDEPAQAVEAAPVEVLPEADTNPDAADEPAVGPIPSLTDTQALRVREFLITDEDTLLDEAAAAAAIAAEVEAEATESEPTVAQPPDPLKFKKLASPPPPLPEPITPFEEELGEAEATMIAPGARAAHPPHPPEPAAPPPPPPPASAPAPKASQEPPPVARPAVAPPPPSAPSAAPRPATRPVARPAAAARPAAPVRKPKPSGGGARLAVGVLAALVIVGAGGYAAWRFLLQPGTPEATPLPPPTTIAEAPPTTIAAVEAPSPTPEATPEVQEDVTIVPTATPTPAPTPSASPLRSPSPSPRTTPTPTPTPRPTATPTPPPATTAAAPLDPRVAQASQVQGLISQAESAAASRNYDVAIARYDDVLRIDPAHAAARQGRQSAVAARDLRRRTFVAGRTVVKTEKADKGLSGFDVADVSVQRAPDFLGRIEFEMSPRAMQGGESWSLKVYVVNEGKKPIRITGLAITTNLDGAPSGGAATPRIREVRPQGRELIGEVGGVFPESVASWSTEVQVTSNKDSLKNTLTWR